MFRYEKIGDGRVHNGHVRLRRSAGATSRPTNDRSRLAPFSGLARDGIGGSRACLFARRGPGAKLADQADQVRRRLSGRRWRRFHCPAVQRAHVQAPRPACGGREPPRRRRHPWSPVRRPRRPGRLHLADCGDLRDFHRACHLQGAALRSGEGPRAGDPACEMAADPGRIAEVPAKHTVRVHRLCESQSGKGQLLVLRQQHPQPRERRALQGRRGHRRPGMCPTAEAGRRSPTSWAGRSSTPSMRLR